MDYDDIAVFKLVVGNRTGMGSKLIYIFAEVLLVLLVLMVVLVMLVILVIKVIVVILVIVVLLVRGVYAL